eukprot:2618449-Rhodomonas_salina.2
MEETGNNDQKRPVGIFRSIERKCTMVAEISSSGTTPSSGVADSMPLFRCQTRRKYRLGCKKIASNTLQHRNTKKGSGHENWKGEKERERQ